jgi:hypothetical protein
MIAVNGIILVLSCQKHLNTRLKHFKLPKEDYGGWKVIYVIGDLFLDCDYKFASLGASDSPASPASLGDLLIIKCEDSYIHLLKKLGLALKYLYDIYEIKEGVLRANDDLIFNEGLLQAFLDSPKIIKNNSKASSEETAIDFLGKSSIAKNLFARDFVFADAKRPPTNSMHLVYYYDDHPEDFDNPQHNIKGISISNYKKQPYVPAFIFGPLYYISNKSCAILINHLENIKYDVFHYDEKTDSYPYTIEDCGVSFIFYYNNIDILHNSSWFKNNDASDASDASNASDASDASDVIAIHTNMFK